MRTRGAHGCVRSTPTGLPDWTSSVSSSSSRRSSRTIASNASQRPRRPAGPAVDDEVVRVLGDLRVEVVHEHPERGFLLPAAAGQLGAARGADGAGSGHAAEPSPPDLRSEAGDDAARRACAAPDRDDRDEDVVVEVDVVGRGAPGARADVDGAPPIVRTVSVPADAAGRLAGGAVVVAPPARRRTASLKTPGRSWTTLTTARSSPLESPGADVRGRSRSADADAARSGFGDERRRRSTGSGSIATPSTVGGRMSSRPRIDDETAPAVAAVARR